ncbi:MAG: double-strand break repair helicase AddA [Parvibaculaceae bacterium]
MNDARVEAGRAQWRASDPQGSAWVAANAGSGKTHVLVNRVIRLMLAGTLPERILCLTFTRAAAAEMSRRLFERLSEWIALDDNALIEAIHGLSGDIHFGGRLDAARRLFARSLETPGGLKIQTIHAFCERLLQRFPVEAGVAPGFKVLEETEAAALLAEARREVVEAASREEGRANEALASVIAFAGEEALDRLLGELLRKRSELKALLSRDDRETLLRQRLCDFLGVAADETPETIAAEALDLLDREACGGGAETLIARTGATDRALAVTLSRVLAARTAEDVHALLKEAFLKKDGGRKADRAILTPKAQAEHPDLAVALLAEADRVASLADRERSLAVCDATLALLALADAVIGAYEEKKLALGRYDYDDLIVRTRSMFQNLESAAWVLYRLDGGIDHILIDEAQDTSRAQWEIVKAIADEFFAGEGQRQDVMRTLFAVGDRKQSIFSFQGADPDAFDEMEVYFRARIRGAGQRFETVPLKTSFRSTQVLLDAVDAVFAGAPARSGVMAEDAEALVHRAVRVNQPGLIEIWVPVPPLKPPAVSRWDPKAVSEAPEKPRPLLARRIAGVIRGWLDAGERLAATGERIRPGDILILLRNRTTFMDMLVKALKQRGIPVAGADRLELGSHLAVQDLLSLLRFVLLPEDDLSLAELLKSPLVARDDGEPVNDDDLMGLAAGRQGSLWAALRRAVAAGAPYGEALQRISNWARRADYEPPFEFLSGVLMRDGGRRKLLARLGPEAAEPVDALLVLALDFAGHEAASLQSFLAFVETEGGEIKRDTDQSAAEVRIMTVHGAKGLEAPVVILPDTCDPPSGRDDAPVLMEGEVPVWRLKTAHEPRRVTALREAHHRKAHEEYNRLLYVAMTRAKDRLYVCGALAKEEPDRDCWHTLVLDALKPRAREMRGTDGTLAGWRIEGSGIAADIAPDLPERAPPAAALPGWALESAPFEADAPRWAAPSHLSGPEAEAEPEEAVSSPLAAGGTARRFRRGLIIHRLLQTLPDRAPDARAPAGAAWLSRAAPDLSGTERKTLLDEAMAILAMPGLEPLFAAGSLAEVPLAAILGDLRITGQVDRLAVTDGEVLIADYKTNRPPPLTLQGVDPAYVRQLAAYRSALRRLYPGKRVRCVLVWTDGPRLMELPDAMLDAAGIG